MATVVVCDRCGATMPDGSDQSSVVTTSTARADLCPRCMDDLSAFAAGAVVDRTQKVQPSQ